MSANIARCGTDSGYYRHKRQKGRNGVSVDACTACRAAHSRAQSARVARTRERGTSTPPVETPVEATVIASDPEPVELVEVPRTLAWQRRSACAGLSLDVFFPEGSRERTEEALAVCLGCPVAQVCLSWALEREGDTWWQFRAGIYGGKTPWQRWQITKARAVA